MNMESYTKRRESLLKSICEYYGEPVQCHDYNCHCTEKLQIHHVHFNGNGYNCGGTKQLIKAENDWIEFLRGDNSKRLMVLCRNCHINIHVAHIQDHQEDD